MEMVHDFINHGQQPTHLTPDSLLVTEEDGLLSVTRMRDSALLFSATDTQVFTIIQEAEWWDKLPKVGIIIKPGITIQKPFQMRVLTQLVTGALGIQAVHVFSPTRKRDVVFARHMVMYLLRQSGHKYTAIGRFMHRDHATVIHGCRSIEDRMEVEPRIAELVRTIRLSLDTIRIKERDNGKE